MNYFVVGIMIVSFLSFYTGCYYLLIFSKRKEGHKNLLFSFICFSITLYNIFSIGIYNSTSVAEGLIWQKLQFMSLALFVISLTWFIYYILTKISKKFCHAITFLMLLLIILGFTINNEYTLSINNPMIKNYTLGSLIHVTYYKASPGIVFLIKYGLAILIAFYLIIQSTWYFYKSKKQYSSSFVISLIIFFIACINDLLVSLNLIEFIFMLEFSFFIILLLMTYSLISNFVDKYNEIEELNVQLEEKIDYRTMELFFSEIALKIYNEIHKNSLESYRLSSEMLEEFFKCGQESSIKNLSQDISIISNFDQLIKIVLEKAMKISKAESGYIFLKEKNNKLVLKKFKTLNEIINSSFSKSIVDKVHNEGKPVIIENDLEKSPKDSHIICLPLLAKDLNVGVCYFECILEKKDIIFITNILLHFLSSITMAMENASLFEKNTLNIKNEVLSPSFEEKLKKIIEYLKRYYKFEISQEGLAASINVHPNSLDRNFKIYTGKQIKEYITELRIQNVAHMIQESDKNIVDLAFDAGFDSLAKFNKAFHRVMKVNPEKYKDSRTNSR